MVPVAEVIPQEWKSMVFETPVLSVTASPSEGTGVDSTNSTDKKANLIKINRLYYEVAVLESLRERLRCKLIWIEGAYRYRNPDDDLPADWETCREACYLQLGLPLKGMRSAKYTYR